MGKAEVADVPYKKVSCPFLVSMSQMPRFGRRFQCTATFRPSGEYAGENIQPTELSRARNPSLRVSGSSS